MRFGSIKTGRNYLLKVTKNDATELLVLHVTRKFVDTQTVAGYGYGGYFFDFVPAQQVSPLNPVVIS